MMKPQVKTTDLEILRQIPASPAEVYAVWTDPKHPGGPWYGSPKVIIDVKVDGLFFTAVEHENKSFAHYGRFTKLDAGTCCEHTWVSPATKGLESIVTTTFEAKDGGTLVRLRHAGVPDDEEGRMHAEGWAWVLGALSDVMASKKK